MHCKSKTFFVLLRYERLKKVSTHQIFLVSRSEDIFSMFKI